MMNVLDRIDISEEALAELARRYHVREIRLFGSVLRDDFREDSDVDVLVEYELNAGISLFDHFNLHEELEQLLGRKVDLVSKPGLHRIIREYVLATSQIVYAA